jgi:hypothetical protein
MCIYLALLGKKSKEEEMKKAIFVPLTLGLATVSSFADQVYGVDITPDYSNFNAAVGLVLAVSIVIMLARRAKSFFR